MLLICDKHIQAGGMVKTEFYIGWGRGTNQWHSKWIYSRRQSGWQGPFKPSPTPLMERKKSLKFQQVFRCKLTQMRKRWNCLSINNIPGNHLCQLPSQPCNKTLAPQLLPSHSLFPLSFFLSPSPKVSRQLHVNFVTPQVLLILLQGWIIGCFKKQVFKQRLKAVLIKQGWKSTRNLSGREQKALSFA